jgi:hypothetical protein
MRRQFLLASMGAITLTGPAFAADLAPVPPPPVPVFTWTGVYLGGRLVMPGAPATIISLHLIQQRGLLSSFPPSAALQMG